MEVKRGLPLIKLARVSYLLGKVRCLKLPRCFRRVMRAKLAYRDDRLGSCPELCNLLMMEHPGESHFLALPPAKHSSRSRCSGQRLKTLRQFNHAFDNFCPRWSS